MKNLLMEICKERGYTDPPNLRGITLSMLIDGWLSGNVIKHVRDITGCAKQTVTNAIKNTFPDKPSNNASTIQWILRKDNKKWCSRCNSVLSLEAYYSNISCYDGRSDFCKECSKSARVAAYRKDPHKELEANARRKRLRNEKQTPSWANREKILEIYRNRPEGMQVDHIIPLNGKYVSGLHVESNLQYLTEQDNLAKKNKFDGAID